MKNLSSGCVHLCPLDTEVVWSGGDSKKNASCNAKYSKVLVSAGVFWGEKNQTKQTKKALDPLLISHTFSSKKIYCRVLFNGLLNTSMYFQFGNNEQNNGEFEIQEFLISFVFQTYVQQSSTQSKHILFLTLSYTDSLLN